MYFLGLLAPYLFAAVNVYIMWKIELFNAARFAELASLLPF